MGRNAKRKSNTTADPKVPKRARNHRTEQNPWEASREDGDDLEVASVSKKEWRKGLAYYLVHWEGFDDQDATWEPAANLVGAAGTIREFNEAKKQEDLRQKGLLVEARRKAKQDREDKERVAAEEALAAQLREAASSEDPATCQPCVADLVGYFVNGRRVHTKHKKKKATVWKAYDLSEECISCAVDIGGKLCGHQPADCGGTTNFWGHLYVHHRAEWLKLKKEDGALTEVGEAEMGVLQASMAARVEKEKTSSAKVQLDAEGAAVLQQLAGECVVADDRDFSDFSSESFKKYAAAMSGGAHQGVDNKTIKSVVAVLAEKGRKNGAETVAMLLADGIKVTISADLWSKNGCALLGILLHGILRQKKLCGKYKWLMTEKLAGAVPCRKDRHTGDYVLEASLDALRPLGITDPDEQVFRGKTDRGSNMVKGYETLKHDPCADHLLETSVGTYTDTPTIKAIISKARGMVGYFNSSTIGKSDLAKHQVALGLKAKALKQDVVTRWRSTYDCQNSIRENMQALILYDACCTDPAKSWSENKLSVVEYQINNQSCAVLHPVTEASTILEGKLYPTSNLVFIYIYGAIATLAPGAATMQPWDSQLLQEADLHETVKTARSALYLDLKSRWVDDIPIDQWTCFAISALCDPRFTSLYIPLFTDEMRHRAHQVFIDEYCMNWAPVESPESSGTPQAASVANSAPPQAAPVPRNGSLESYMQSISHVTQASTIPKPAVVQLNEARAYLDAVSEPFSQDPLLWWSDHEDEYPHLARMAQQYLGCPATSASAERVFSLAGRLYNDNRQNMTDITLEERMWAKVNHSIF